MQEALLGKMVEGLRNMVEGLVPWQLPEKGWRMLAPLCLYLTPQTSGPMQLLEYGCSVACPNSRLLSLGRAELA
jgi:hypothetical protein